MATLYPQLAEEWSDRNLPLTPDTVNDKSRKNVWWKCRTCGYEWKSVIHSRAKGAMCPVCADRAVLTGYNDLATTDPHLIDEWDFDKNTVFSPERISRSSMYSVWWKCPLNHSWKAKISERAIEGKGCRVCETDYKHSRLKIAVMYYAGMKGLSFKYDDDGAIGIPLETYMVQLVESIKTNGVLTPAVLRQKEDGRYEIVSGHRRKRACELAGLTTLRSEIKDLTRDP